jgi:hypothetical protein
LFSLCKIDQGATLAGHLSLSPAGISFSLLFSLSYADGHKGGEAPEAILPRSCPPLSLSPSPPQIPNRRRATAQEEPQDPTCTPLTSPPHQSLSLSPMPPERTRWRPRLRRQASSLCRASALLGTPPMSPNQQQLTTPPVGPSTARALTVLHPHRGRPERVSRSQ